MYDKTCKKIKMIIFKDINKLENILKEKTGICKQTDKNLITLCPNCEFDRFHKNRNHGHLYISLDMPLFNCFRCEFKGIAIKLFNKFSLNINDYLITPLVDTDISKYTVRNNDNIFIENNIKNIVINNDNEIETKINYIKTRLNITHDQVLKIPGLVFDIYKFINENKILLDKKYEHFDLNEYVGFLTNNKSILVCRSVLDKPTNNKRYIHMRLDSQKYFFKEFYGLNLSKNGKYIVLCEGIFDLLNSIFNKEIINEVSKQAYFISTALTNNYQNTIVTTLNHLKRPISDFVILSDADVKLDYYKGLKRFTPQIGNLTVYYNNKGKDFGEQEIEFIRYKL